jgi:hypothetical protein
MLAMIHRQRLRAAIETSTRDLLKPSPPPPIHWTEVQRRIMAGIEADRVERAEAHRRIGMSFRGRVAEDELELDQ